MRTVINSSAAPSALAFLLGLWMASPLAAQSSEAVAAARRIADVVAIALAEYRVGVVDGRVVAPEELAETRLFLDEARRWEGALDDATREMVERQLDRLARGVRSLVPVAALEAELAALRAALEEAVGVPLLPLPEGAPSLAVGRAVYEARCAACHGAGGAGDGPLAAGLEPPPADLTARDALRSASPAEFFRKINVGVAGTAMPAYQDRLSLDDRWAVALWATTLRFSPQLAGRGAVLLDRRCAGCVVELADFGATAPLTDDSLRGTLAEWAGATDDSLLTALLAYARLAGAAEERGGDAALATRRTVRRAGERVDAAVRAALAGDREGARRAAVDAYLVFEEIESAVRARDAGAARRAERAFAALRAAAEAPDGRAPERVGRQVHGALDAAAEAITAGGSPGVLFAQALVIMLREGLEAILIVGALVAFLAKAGAPERRRDVGTGVVAAVGASLVTAGAFATLFRSAVAHREVLEGVTMLVAAAVLFWVSYWLVSKIEVRKWQAFVRAQMARALTSRRALALTAVAFLAVYREGFETVLFYAALFSAAGAGTGAPSAIVAGILAGLAILGVVYYGMQRYGARLPLKPFFAVTSALLYVMAFSFAGRGVAELQAAGLVSATPLGWLPSVPILGIFPTIQTLLSQLVLGAALLGALVWVFWLEPKTSGARAPA